MPLEAYLDIETTGLCRFNDEVTVIGIYLVGHCFEKVVQLVGGNATAGKLLKALSDVDTIYTYNGNHFDLPFIKNALGIDLKQQFVHQDLMYDCWRCHLHGGLKAVERTLGIPRRLAGVDGYQAVILWWRYCNRGDERALTTLLEYNKEDIVNLKALKERLETTFY